MDYENNGQLQPRHITAPPQMRGDKGDGIKSKMLPAGFLMLQQSEKKNYWEKVKLCNKSKNAESKRFL